MTTSLNQKTVEINNVRNDHKPWVERKRASVLLLIAMIFAASYSHLTLRGVAKSSGEPQGSGCNDEKCKVKELVINTGYDPMTQTVLAATTPATVTDPYWELVDAPSAVDSDGNSYPDTPGSTTLLSMPSPAWVIKKDTAWNDLPLNSTPQSGWISAYNTPSSNLNNTDELPNWIPPPNTPYKYAPYAFQRCFCTCAGVDSIKLHFQMLDDNVAYVFFDGVQIDKNLDIGLGAFQTPYLVDKTIPGIQPGRHCLKIEVRNRTGVSMGLNVLGTITSDPPGSPLFLSPTCCAPTSKIIGRKIDDKNCNGKNDNNATSQSIEPGLQGWTIVAVNTSTGANFTAVTDANGYYYFNNLPPGTYTVSEQSQSGWSQTIPGSPGTYTVTAAAGQVVQLDFGNCRKGETPCVEITAKEVTCKPGSLRHSLPS